MRILVTGKKGQLGRSIKKIVNTYAEVDNSQNLNDFIFVGREELDLSDESLITQYFDNNKFDIIINCAAYTHVDIAEQEPELVNQINHLAVKYLATIASNQQAILIHISTDYVFDGESDKSYKETDVPNPINVYGRTKLAGEQALQTAMPMNALIIRTSWVYSEYGNNFVSTMLKLGKEQDELAVVIDQLGSPTYATDLAKLILTIIKSKGFINHSQATEIYHYSNAGKISWHDFAKQIFKTAKIDCKLNMIKSEEFQTLAKRPKNTCLDNSKVTETFGFTSLFWKESLARCLIQIKDGLQSTI
tara:strand:- start:781 stop:1692 length:912 start_codon:yes stop_codon:yes gene_type:complete